MDVTETGHLHRCREGHAWYHSGPTARTCRIREYPAGAGGRYISPEDCALCTGREDLLVRARHAHRCPTCNGPWTHEGRCAEGVAAQCPWCFRRPGASAAPGMREGPHKHLCPTCLKTWEHQELCAFPLRVALPECPVCHPPDPEAAAEPVGAALPSWRTSVLGGGGDRRRARRRRRIGWALMVLVGVALGVALRVFLGPPDASRRASSPPPPQAASSVAPEATQSASSDPAAVAPERTREPGPIVSARAEPPVATTPAAPVPARAAPERPASPPAGRAAAAEPGAPVKTAPEPRPVQRGLPEEGCVKPTTPRLAVSLESGKALGPWVGVETDRDAVPPRCLYVIQRPEGALWVIDASRVRIERP